MLPNSPITGKSEVAFERWFEVERIIEQYQTEWSIDVSPYFTGATQVGLYRCKKTGYRFFHPFTVAGDQRFYEKLASQSAYHVNFKKWEVDFATTFIEPHHRILDVGCGDGLNLNFLREHGAEVEGIEQNAVSLRLARERGHTVHQVAIEAFATNHPASYDCVTLFQVLEHFAEPGALLDLLETLVKPKGLLIIGVPNNVPYLFGDADYFTLNLPPHHLGLWNANSLKKLARVREYDLVDVQVEPGSDHLPGRTVAASFRMSKDGTRRHQAGISG